MLFLIPCVKIDTSSIKTSVQTSIGKVILTIDRKWIFSQSEKFHFQTFPGRMPPDPLESPNKIFPLLGFQTFLGDFEPPKNINRSTSPYLDLPR